jgi:hypothetical protein
VKRRNSERIKVVFCKLEKDSSMKCFGRNAVLGIVSCPHSLETCRKKAHAVGFSLSLLLSTLFFV